MAEREPEAYRTVLAADKESLNYYSGHGAAIAQAYNHTILPLSNSRDKYTQVFWGLRDFQFRFGREPEGMWLPETAVDLETLDILVRLGLRYTILSPYQARRIRRLKSRVWKDVDSGQVDPTTPYQVRLPSGKAITVFFYDGPISQAVAFENLLASGEIGFAIGVRFFRAGACLAAAGTHRNRWRNIWSSPQTRRHGSGVRFELHSKRTNWQD